MPEAAASLRNSHLAVEKVSSPIFYERESQSPMVMLIESGPG